MITASVKAEVTISVNVGNWNGDESFKSLHEQVVRNARNKIMSKLAHDGIQIIGEPKISVVMAGEA